MKLDNNMMILVMVIVGAGLLLYFNNNKEGFDNMLDRIPWDEICKKEYCDLPNYYNEIYPNKNKYKANTVYSRNGTCCLLTDEMRKCLSSRGSTKYCKFLLK